MAGDQIKIDFNALVDIAHRGARRAAAFIAMGEKAWSDETIRSATVATPFSIQLLPDPMPKELAGEVRRAFRQWVISNALVEIVHALALFADDYYRIAVSLVSHKQKMPQEALDRIKKFAQDTNIASKLMVIEAECKLTSPLNEHADGWARARNAHAHNRGIVRERDYNPDCQELTVSWRQFDFMIDGQKIENIIGHQVEKEGVLEFVYGHAEKKFKAGELIEFTEQEILNICLTAYLGVSNSVKELEKRVSETISVAAEVKPA